MVAIGGTGLAGFRLGLASFSWESFGREPLKANLDTLSSVGRMRQTRQLGGFSVNLKYTLVKDAGASRKKFRFQYSLATLGIGITLFCVFLAIWPRVVAYRTREIVHLEEESPDGQWTARIVSDRHSVFARGRRVFWKIRHADGLEWYMEQLGMDESEQQINRKYELVCSDEEVAVRFEVDYQPLQLTIPKRVLDDIRGSKLKQVDAAKEDVTANRDSPEPQP